MNRRRQLSVLVLPVAVALAASLAPAAAAPAPPGAGGASGALPARAVAQIDALAAAKLARTPAQRKVSSQVLVAASQRAGKAAAAGVGPLTTTVTVTAAGLSHVTITAAATSDAGTVAKAVTALRGTVRSQSGQTVDADVPIAAVDALAGSAAVRRIDAADRAATTAAAALSPGDVQGRVRRATGGAVPKVGSVTTEGDAALAADVARARYRVGGAGVTVGVLSDGVDSLPDSIADGDLPPDTHALPGQAGSGDEGTAMLEIVHDIAPTASLLFATAVTSETSFADNIRALRAAGADVIVDDVLYFDEDPFQDGPAAQAVLDVTADGATYFSSAGNQGNVDDGTSGNWEGDYVNSGQSIGKFGGKAHDFAPGDAVQTSDPVSDDSAGAPTTLFWADPLGQAKDDYDLYVLDGSGNVVAVSNDTQDGDDNPYERVDLPFASGMRVAVVKFKGADRYLQVSSLGGRFEDDAGLTGFVTPGVTRGHSAVPAAYSVAAAPAAEPLPFEIEPGLANPSGPYPGVYTAAQQTEVFTSDGPRRVFFTPDGRPITPGNTTSTGGQVRAKPDLTSADGVSTGVPGFSPFFGTSAAAPHAAALAALVISGNPGISARALRTALRSAATDIEAPGVDRDTGAGITLAPKLLGLTGATSQPLVTASLVSVVPAGDGDPYLDPGETATVTLLLTNTGDGTAGNVNVSLTSPAAGVAPSLRQVGTIPRGGQRQVVFGIGVPAGTEPGTVVPLTATVRYSGAYSPTATTFTSLVVGQPGGRVQSVSYDGPEVTVPDDVPAGIDIPLAVPGIGAASSVTFSIDGTDCSDPATVGLEDTYDGDLIASLVAPDGTSVTLFSRVGSTGDNFCQTVFSDAATIPIQGQPATAAPFTGTYQPASPLAGFVGTDTAGTWLLHVSDNAHADTGIVRAFTLQVAGFGG